MLKARFRLRAVSSVRLAEACPKSSTAAKRTGSRRKHSFIHAYFQNSTFDLKNMFIVRDPPTPAWSTAKRPRARMRVTEVRKAGSSDTRRPKKECIYH